MSGQDLGDIDVLCLDRRTETLWVVECKDLAGAVSPSDVVDEMTEHFEDAPNTSVARLLARVAWAEDRRAGALALFGEQSRPEPWRVQGVVVTSHPVMAPLISDLPVDVVTIDDLPGWLDRHPPTKARKRQRKRRARRS